MTYKSVNSKELNQPHGYCHACLVGSGKIAYISGCLPLDRDGSVLAKGDFAGQVKIALSNMGKVLEEVGATFNEVVKMNFFVTGFNKERLAVVRDTRRAFINMDRPPSITTVGIECLYDPEILVEIEAVAAID
jgi:enamine deaminase RidA (YjgF/YER057c/UK114 family)